MRAVGKWTALLAVGVLIGQVFGLLRTLYVADRVGISSSFDAVLVAMVVPAIIGSWLSNATSVAIVPAYIQAVHRIGETEARRFLAAILTYTTLASIVALAGVVAFAGLSVLIAGPGLAPDAKDFAVRSVPILAPTIAFVTLGAMLTAVCQIHRRFLPIAASSAAGPLAGLLVTVMFWDQFGLTAYAAGVTIDGATTLLVLVGAAMRRGLLPRPSLHANVEEAKAFARHVLPMGVGSGVLQLNLISDRAIATLLSAGAASALKYGQQIVTAPAAALSTSWATAIYPSVVSASAPNSETSMGAAMTTSLRYTLAIFIPLAVAAVALAPLGVDVVYGRGAFDSPAVRTTTLVVAAFAPMLVLTMVRPVFTAAHNARRRGTLLALAGILNATLNVVLNVLFGSVLGVAGIALSSSVTLAIVLVFFAWRVRPDEAFRAREVIGVGTRVLAASLVPGIPIGLFAWSTPLNGDFTGHVVMLVACAAAGVIGYVLAARLLGIPEASTILRVLARSVRRRVAAARGA